MTNEVCRIWKLLSYRSERFGVQLLTHFDYFVKHLWDAEPEVFCRPLPVVNVIVQILTLSFCHPGNPIQAKMARSRQDRTQQERRKPNERDVIIPTHICVYVSFVYRLWNSSTCLLVLSRWLSFYLYDFICMLCLVMLDAFSRVCFFA